MPVEIVFDTSELDEVRHELGAIPGAMERATRTAMRKTRRNLDTRTRQNIAKYYGMKVKALKGRIVAGKRDDYSVWIGYSPIQIADYFSSSRYKQAARGLIVGRPRELVLDAWKNKNARGGIFAGIRTTSDSYPTTRARLPLHGNRIENLLNIALVETQPLLQENMEKAVRAALERS